MDRHLRRTEDLLVLHGSLARGGTVSHLTMTEEEYKNYRMRRLMDAMPIASAPSTTLDKASQTKPVRMNKLEAEYALYLKALEYSQEILWYGFESVKLRLADKTFYTPDFAVLGIDGLEFRETKGFMRDDAAVKLKVAAEHFPFKFVLVKKVKGEWQHKTISNGQQAGRPGQGSRSPAMPTLLT